MTNSLDAWEAASEQAEVSRQAVAEAALRHVATAVLAVMPDAVYLEVSFGSFGDGLVAESLHVEGDVSAVSELPEDVHDALDDLNEYNAGTWMPFVLDDEEEIEDVLASSVDQGSGAAAEDAADDDEQPLLIDLTLVRERLG